MHKTDKDLENLLRAENLPNRVKDIECKMQEDSWTPQILNTRNRQIKLLSFKCVVPFMKKKEKFREWICQPKRQEPEATEKYSRT